MKRPIYNTIKELTAGQIWAVLGAVGICLGTSFSIGFAVKGYDANAKIESLRGEITLLKHTQYTKVNDLIDAQRSVYQREIEILESRLQDLNQLVLEQESRAADLQAELEKYTSKRLETVKKFLLEIAILGKTLEEYLATPDRPLKPAYELILNSIVDLSVESRVDSIEFAREFDEGRRRLGISTQLQRDQSIQPIQTNPENSLDLTDIIPDLRLCGQDGSWGGYGTNHPRNPCALLRLYEETIDDVDRLLLTQEDPS